MRLRQQRGPNIVAMLVGTLCCAAALHADDNLLDIAPEPQEMPSWCWAAVSTMAAHSFDIDIAVNFVAQQDDDGVDEVPNHVISQRDIVTLQNADINTLAELGTRKKAFLDSACRAANACDAPGETFLFDIHGLKPPANFVITKDRLIHEIHDLKKPIIIKWNLSGTTEQLAHDEDFPRRKHYLIITGFNPIDKTFRVFDPYRGADSTKPGMERWISYEGYVDPGFYVGQGIVPMHTDDVFGLTRGDGKIKKAKRSNKGVTEQPPVQQIALEPVDFGDLVQANDAIHNLIPGRVVFTRDRVRITDPLTVGQVYPIVVITTTQLMQARSRPEVLVVPRTSAVMATVIKAASGEIVDSIQMYHERGGWKEAHYSNTQITELMETVRSNHPINPRDPSHSYYLVSIPEQDEFFAAHGFGPNAVLTSLNNDARGSGVSANDALGGVIKKVDAAMGRQIPHPQARAPTAGSSPLAR